MLEKNNSIVDYEQLQTAIKDVLKSRMSQPKQSEQQHDEIISNSDLMDIPMVFDVHELLVFEQEEFVHKAYLYILRRDCDTEGLKHYTNLLNKGVSRLAILMKLSLSEEARNCSIHIKGLYRAWLMEKILSSVLLNKLSRVSAHPAGWLAKIFDKPGLAEIPLWLKGIFDIGRISARLDYFQNYNKEQLVRIKQIHTELQQQKKQVSFYRQSMEHLLVNNNLLNTQLSSCIQQIRSLERQILKSEPLSHTQQTITQPELNDYKFDQFYLAFEDQFRGDRQSITERLSVYLPFVDELFSQHQQLKKTDNLILDIGCGRGEWLELLQQQGYACHGVDSNETMVEFCQSGELQATHQDALTYLKQCNEQQLALITGFHIIEHVPFNRLIELFDECLRVLKPGGLLIFETPNSENMQVGTHNFYTDPTHSNPLPFALTEFLAKHRGFSRVEIKKLHPYPDDYQLDEQDNPTAKLINHFYFGAQDYALLANK